MNHDFEPSIRVPSPSKRWQLLKVAGYVALVVLVVWLSSIPPKGEKPRDSSKADGPVASDSTRPREGRPSKGLEPDRPIQRKDRRGPSSSDDRELQPPISVPAKSDESRDGAVIVRNVRLTNEDGKVIYRGDIDLAATLDRIDRGTRLRFSHDGIVFQNRERRLPIQPGGYYHEFIHPTKGVGGPGGQRIVEGRGGEVYYSPDHYRTFRRVR